MTSKAIPVHVALVDKTGTIEQAMLAEVAGALNEQIQADFAPVWHVAATVGAYPSAPAGTWAVLIERKLDQPGALGYHTDEHNQPVAYVELTADWPVTVSHETLEMLADPFGSRMHRARLPEGIGADGEFKRFGLAQEHSYVHYLLEVCDPPEAKSYEVGGVPVSSFLLPPWYRSTPVAQANAYDHAGACSAPRQVADGGYVSFGNLSSGEWFQVFNEGGTLQVQDIGRFDKASYGSLREWTDEKSRERRARR